MKTVFRPLIFGITVLLISGLSQAGSDAPATHLKFISTYLQPGTETPDYDYLPEVLTHLTSSHVSPELFGRVRDRLQEKQAIIDLANEIFYYGDNGATLKPDYQDILDSVGKNYLDGYMQNVLAIYVVDEPTVFKIPRKTLEQVIAAVKTRFPGTPTYIVWNASCFDNIPDNDDACGLPGQRGVPAGLDWIGFDWYLKGQPADDQANFKAQIIATTRRLKKLTNIPIVLVPDGTDEYVQDFPQELRDSFLASRMKRFYDYAQSESRVIGLDNYAWADHSEMFHDGMRRIIGLRSFPTTKALLFDYADKLKAGP